MEEKRTFRELSSADQIALVGNLLFVIGGMCVSVSQLLRLSESGRIGEQVINPTQMYPGNQNSNGGAPSTRAREFFL